MSELKIEEIETGKTHLIEANAGTGKTYAIANLFLRWILEGRRAREILVVTFTNAATDELRGRIRARLAEARQMLRRGQADEDADPWFAGLPERYPEGEARQKALLDLDLALLEIGEAPIHTIHGFCQQTLADRALASGQPFELEQSDEDTLIEHFLGDWWRKRTYKMDPRNLAAYSKITGGFKDFSDLAKRLIKSSTLEPLLNHETADLEAYTKEIGQVLHDLARAWSEEREDIRALFGDKDFPLNRQGISSKLDAMESMDHSLLVTPPGMPSEKKLEKIRRSALKLKKDHTDEHIRQLDQYRFLQLADTLHDLLKSDLAGDALSRELIDARNFVQGQIRQTNLRLGRQSFRDMIENLYQALRDDDKHNGQLAQQIATDYPVIMVDEFQDTDPLQYDIFSRIHHAGRETGHTLILIGDPKQAIYGFRGGDIFTYMQARSDADTLWSLSTNWRSTPELIAAVNQVFAGNNPFAYEEIPYHPSSAPDGKAAQPLLVDGQPEPPLVLERLPRKENGKPHNKTTVEAFVHQSVARRIAKLLALGREGRAMLGERPLQPGDIAILVKGHREGAAIRDALLAHGVRAVTAGNDSIWQSDEAEALLRLLEAAILPGERSLLRQALATDLFDLSVQELHDRMADTEWWSGWVELLAGTGERWRQRGFMSGFQHLLQGLSALLGTETEAGWLSRSIHPERTLTNLLHLADLLQTASQEHAAPEHLLAWMKERMEAETRGSDETLPRLESDEKLVRIATIHASKGLQYPVVFVPYLWNPPGGKSKDIDWHETDAEGQLHHYFSPVACGRGTNAAAREKLAEAVRRAYVALTRAESHCHLHFGEGGRDWGTTALVWLFSEQEHDFDTGGFKQEGGISLPETLVKHPHIRVIEAQDEAAGAETEETESAPATDQPELQRASFHRSVRRNWRIGSFSAMTRSVHQATRAPAATGAERFALKYPAGAHIGNLLHGLLEHIDPAEDIGEQVRRLTGWMFPLYGIPDDDTHRDLDGLAAWIDEVLDTPLDAQGLTLRALDRDRMLHELEFDLGTGLIEKDGVNALLARTDANERTPLDFDDFQGMLNGAIDLVFEHQGRYYLADYKSNLLGRTLEDYRPERLQQEIRDRHYDLQYLIYTLALHRHLRTRLPDYDYERHFGGVYYLFLRGMRPQHGPAYGVWFGRPDARIIEEMDENIIGLPAEPAAARPRSTPVTEP